MYLNMNVLLYRRRIKLKPHHLIASKYVSRVIWEECGSQTASPKIKAVDIITLSKPIIWNKSSPPEGILRLVWPMEESLLSFE